MIALPVDIDRIPVQSRPPSGPLGHLREYLAHLSLFSRNARLYLIGAFLMGVNFEVYQFLLNLYLKELRFGEGDIGFVNSFRALGIALMAVPSAVLFSRLKLKPFLITAVVMFAVASFLITTSTKMGMLVTFSLLAGISWSFFRVAGGPFYIRNSTPVERTHLFSCSFAVLLLSGMLGSAGSGKLVTIITSATGSSILGYQIALYFGIAVGILALIPFSMIKPFGPEVNDRPLKIRLATFRHRGGFYLKLTSINFLIGLGAGLIIPFLSLFFRDRFHLPPDRIGLVYLSVSAAMLIGTLAGPLLVKRLGLVRTVVYTQVASIPFMLTLAYSYFLPLVVFAFILRGALMNLAGPLSTNLAMEIADESEQGFVNALLTVAWTGSWMIAVAVGGHLIETYGYSLTLNIASGLYLLASLLYFSFFRSIEQRREKGSGWYIPEREG